MILGSPREYLLNLIYPFSGTWLNTYSYPKKLGLGYIVKHLYTGELMGLVDLDYGCLPLSAQSRAQVSLAAFNCTATIDAPTAATIKSTARSYKVLFSY